MHIWFCVAPPAGSTAQSCLSVKAAGRALASDQTSGEALESDGAGHRPVRSRARGLEGAAGVELAVGTAIALALSAEMEVVLRGIAKRPAAVGGQERSNRLALVQRNVEIVFWPKGRRRASDFAHLRNVARNRCCLRAALNHAIAKGLRRHFLGCRRTSECVQINLS